MRREEPKIETEGQDRGGPPPNVELGVREHCELPSGVRAEPKVFHYFQHSDWLLIHLLIHSFIHSFIHSVKSS